jgi:hypothetical protein
LVINPNTPDILYALSRRQGVLKSIDGGASWTIMNRGLTDSTVHALAMDLFAPTTIYGSGSDGVYRYDDLGDDALDGSDSSDSSDFFCFITASSTWFRKAKNEFTTLHLLILSLIGFAVIRWIYHSQTP